jgi:hypothetical protein
MRYSCMRNLSVLIVITMLVALPFISFDSSAESVVSQPNENSGLYSVYLSDPTLSYDGGVATVWSKNNNDVRTLDRSSKFDKMVMYFYVDDSKYDSTKPGLARFSYDIRSPSGDVIYQGKDPQIQSYYNPVNGYPYWSFRGWAGQMQAFAPVGSTMLCYELTIPEYLYLDIPGIYTINIELSLPIAPDKYQTQYQVIQTATIQFLNPTELNDDAVKLYDLSFSSPNGGDVPGDDSSIIWSRNILANESRQLVQLSSYDSLTVRFYAPDYLRPMQETKLYVTILNPDGSVLKHVVTDMYWIKKQVKDGVNIPEGSRLYSFRCDFTSPMYLSQNGNYSVQIIMEINGYVYDKYTGEFVVQYYELVADHISAILWIFIILIPAMILGMVFSSIGFSLGVLMMAIALVLFAIIPLWVVVVCVFGVAIVLYKRARRG